MNIIDPAPRRPARESLEALARDFTASLQVEESPARQLWLFAASGVLVVALACSWVLRPEAVAASKPRPAVRVTAVAELQQRRLEAERARARASRQASYDYLDKMAAEDQALLAGVRPPSPSP